MSIHKVRHVRLLGMVTAGCLALSIAGCASGSTDPAAEKADEPITLTFLSHYGAEPMKSGMEELIKGWNSTHPDIQVKWQSVAFNDLLTTINVRQTGGQAADVVSAYALWGGQLAENGVLDTPPEDVAKDIKENYSPAAVSAVSGGDGTLLGYPTELSTYVLYYNKRLLKDAGITEPPQTWDELKTVAKKVTKKDSSGNYLVEGLSLIQDGDNQTAHPFLSLLDSAEGEFLKSDGTSALDDRARAVLELESELAADGSTTTAIMPTKTFPSGTVAMAIQASWWVGSLKSQMKDAYSDVGTAPVPGPTAGDKGSLAYAFFTGVNANSRHKAQAWEFVTWLNTSQNAEGVTNMGNFLATNGLIPPRKADADKIGKQLLADDPNLQAVYDAADYAMAESNALNAYKAKTSLHNTVNRILLGEAEVDSAFESLIEEVNAK